VRCGARREYARPGWSLIQHAMLPAEKHRSFEGFGPAPQGDRGGDRRGDAPDLACLSTCAPSSLPAAASASRQAPRHGTDDGRPMGELVAGRYRIEAPLGHGAMGAVYRATRITDGAPVAIKLMHARLTRDESVARRFDREVAVATRLDHRNCVRVLEGGTTEDGTKFLVMPLLRGVELRQRLTGPMPAAWVVDIVGQVLRGLDHAHRLGFVHRDVKPENVFIVREEAGTDIAQLLDFGLVKLLDPVAGGVPLTREGLVFGTPAYMSPEQAAGQRIDARADLYGVGVMMYEMLAGAPPFQADEAIVLLRRQMLADPPALPPEVPAPLAAFVMRLLEKNPRDRFASATEALAVLAHASRGRAPTRSVSAGRIASPSPAELSWHAAASSEPSWAPSASLIRSSATEQRAFAIVALVLALLAGGLWAALRGNPETADADVATPSSTAAAISEPTPEPQPEPEPEPEPEPTPAPTPTAEPVTSTAPVPAPAAEPTTPKAEPQPPKAAPKTKTKAKPKSQPTVEPKATPSRTPRATPTPTPEPSKTRVLRTDRPPRTPVKSSKLPTTSLPKSRIPARRLPPRTS
jgi:eukaryotic-like serine/threonine-protein kinase